MKRIAHLTLALALLAFGSCSIYHPQTVDIPLINHAGDTRVDAAVGVSAFLMLPDVLTVGGTVSHGFNDWIAGQVHLNYGGENVYAQAAPGAYLPLGAHSVLEGYVGLGAGAAWRKPTWSSSDTAVAYATHYGYNGRFLLPFVQANIGWHDLTAAHIDLALGLKTGAYCPDFLYRRYDPDGTPLPDHDVHYNTPNLLFEPQLQFRIGSERVKYCFRASVSVMSDMDNESGDHFTTDLLTISNGLTFSF